MIVENWLAGRRRHVWLSVSPDLEHDARRDLRDLTARMEGRVEIPVFSLSKMSYREVGRSEGVLFCTYSALVSREGLNAAEKDRQAALEEGDEGAAAAASAGGAAKRRRLDQIVAWMRGAPPLAAAAAGGGAASAGGGAGGGAGAGAAATSAGKRAKVEGGGACGCVLFDECHKAKNLLPSPNGGQSSQTARAVVELQEALPRARVVYCSATGASSVKNMAYMTRLGLWGEETAFGDFAAFAHAIDKAGVGAMELVALDMKQRGM